MAWRAVEDEGAIRGGGEREGVGRFWREEGRGKGREGA